MQVKSQDLCEGVIRDPESLPSRQSFTPQCPILSVYSFLAILQRGLTYANGRVLE